MSEDNGLSLSNENVVRELILRRGEFGTSFNKMQTNSSYEISQELLVLYASLDQLIEKVNFNERQNRLLSLLYKGYTIFDIHNMDIGYGRSATYDLFNRMVATIARTNSELRREKKREA